MKKICLLFFAVAFCLSSYAQYVDLGLPSGTMWMSKNEDGLYNYDDAVKKFGDKLPTKEQLEELKNKCKWTWNGNGYRVTGPNGKSIVLPAAGCKLHGIVHAKDEVGFYWSNVPDGSLAWALYLNSVKFDMSLYKREDGLSVRLVQKSSRQNGDSGHTSGTTGTDKNEKISNNSEESPQYVDLGLPSGTKWMSKNEEGLYNYDDAVKKFGNKLPTKEQFEELKDKCSWTWTGKDYKVTGPNGKSIVLPAAGIHNCDGNPFFVDKYGYYWSSTSSGSETAWCSYFYVEGVFVANDYRCQSNSVRLVQD